MNLLQELIIKHPMASWNWKLLSSNPSITFDFILAHPELPWAWKYISMNQSINEKEVRSRLECPWDFEGLVMNPNISLSFFEEYMIKPDVVHYVDWDRISANPSITMIDVINNPKYKWNDFYLSTNPNVNSNFIMNEGSDRKWHIPAISANPGITTRDIFKSTLKSFLSMNKGWCFKNLSANPNLPIPFVNENLNQDWNYFSMSINVSMTDMETYKQISWDGYGLSLNKNISFDYVKYRSDIKWDVKSLLSNSGITLKDIVDNNSWFRNQLSKKDCITSMSSNPNITLQWIADNYRDIDWNALSMNRLQK